MLLLFGAAEVLAVATILAAVVAVAANDNIAAMSATLVAAVPAAVVASAVAHIAAIGPALVVAAAVTAAVWCCCCSCYCYYCHGVFFRPARATKPCKLRYKTAAPSQIPRKLQYKGSLGGVLGPLWGSLGAS